MKNKKIIFVASALLLLASFTLVNAETNGQPFLALQDAINNLQSQIDNLRSQISDSDTGGAHRKVYTGTIPSSLPSTLGDDDKVVDTELTEQGITYRRLDYYKIVTIPEINTNDMPQVDFYVKVTEGTYAGLGDGTWLLATGNFMFARDGKVYLPYASDMTGSPYGLGLEMDHEMAGRDYKIVVVY